MLIADMPSQSEVRRLANVALQKLPRIDVLVNNVGGYWNTPHVSADGLELTFALNYLASFLLTNLLLDLLTRSSAAWVVTVSSHAHARGRIEFADLQGEASYSGGWAYKQFQARQNHVHLWLARRLRGSSVTATVLHPGVGRTEFGAEDPGGIQRLLVPFAKRFPVRALSPRSTWPPPPISTTCQASILSTESRNDRRSVTSTKPPPPDSGRSAPTWSA
jgi:retinol dehydrogenase 14